MKFLIAAIAVLVSSPAVAAEAGWVCHYDAPKDEFSRVMGVSDDLEKFEFKGTELVVDDPLASALWGEGTTSHFHIVANNDVGIVATYAAADKGDIYSQTISIMRDPLGKAVKTVTSIKDPKANLILTGTCRSY